MGTARPLGAAFTSLAATARTTPLPRGTSALAAMAAAGAAALARFAVLIILLHDLRRHAAAVALAITGAPDLMARVASATTQSATRPKPYQEDACAVLVD